MVLDRSGIDQNVVHVYGHKAFINELLENVIHHGLEGSWAVGETEYMTRGSKSPRLIQKAAFHSSPSLMCTLLYPQCMSNFVKYLALASEILLIISGTRGSR